MTLPKEIGTVTIYNGYRQTGRTTRLMLAVIDFVQRVPMDVLYATDWIDREKTRFEALAYATVKDTDSLNALLTRVKIVSRADLLKLLTDPAREGNPYKHIFIDNCDSLETSFINNYTKVNGTSATLVTRC